MILTSFTKCLQQLASVVAGDTSAHMTTSTGNTIAAEHSHLVMRVLAGGNMSAHSKFARECDVACGRYHTSRFDSTLRTWPHIFTPKVFCMRYVLSLL